MTIAKYTPYGLAMFLNFRVILASLFKSMFVTELVARIALIIGLDCDVCYLFCNKEVPPMSLGMNNV